MNAKKQEAKKMANEEPSRLRASVLLLALAAMNSAMAAEEDWVFDVTRHRPPVSSSVAAAKDISLDSRTAEKAGSVAGAVETRTLSQGISPAGRLSTKPLGFYFIVR